jgi:hypothetical protein
MLKDHKDRCTGLARWHPKRVHRPQPDRSPTPRQIFALPNNCRSKYRIYCGKLMMAAILTWTASLGDRGRGVRIYCGRVEGGR